MSIALYIFCLALPLTVPFTDVLSVDTGIGDFGWNIYGKEVHVDIDFL